MQQKERTLELKIKNALVQMYIQQRITSTQYDHIIVHVKNLCEQAHDEHKAALDTFDDLDLKRRTMAQYDANLYAEMQNVLLNFFNTVVLQRIQKVSIHLTLETLKQEIEAIETSSPPESCIPVISKKTLNKEEEMKDQHQQKLTKIMQKLYTNGEISVYQHKKLLDTNIMHEFYTTLCNKIKDINESVTIYYQYYIESKITGAEHIQRAVLINKDFITTINDFFRSNSSKKQTHKKTTSSDYFGAYESPSAGLDPFFDYHEQEQISPRTSSEEKEITS